MSDKSFDNARHSGDIEKNLNRLTDEDILRYRLEIDKIIHEICSGKLYGVKYNDVYQAMKFYYREQNYETPFVVVCENPMEMQLIANVMKNLYFSKEKKFMNLYNQCLNIARANDADIDMLEMASKALLDYILPSVVKLVEFYKSSDAKDDNRAHQKKVFKKLLEEDEIIKNIFKNNRSAKDVLRDIFSSAANLLPTTGIFSFYHYLTLDMLKNYYSVNIIDFENFKKYHEKSRVMYALTYKDVVVVCKYPKRVYLDQNNRFHNTKGAAIEMGYLHPVLCADLYYIHGRSVENENIIKNGFSVEDFIYCTDEEERAMMFEIVNERSPDEIINFFNLDEVDRQTIVHDVKIPMYNSLGEFVGYKESQEEETLVLYHTRTEYEGIKDPLNPESTKNKLAWIRFVCPSTGTNYMIYTSPSFKSVVEAAKHSRPFDVETEYKWVQRS